MDLTRRQGVFAFLGGCLIGGIAAMLAGLLRPDYNARARLEKIRAGGLTQDSILTLSTSLIISPNDFRLMCADLACTREHNPGKSVDTLTDGFWFRASPDLDVGDESKFFYNCHRTEKNGIWFTEVFYAGIPKTKYFVGVNEVIWHYQRMEELRAGGFSKEDRLTRIHREAKGKPWQ